MANEYRFNDPDLDDMGVDGDLSEDDEDQALDGVCQVCGCTDEAACPGGCIWATPAADLCSRCAQKE